jgi:hypothetical protein
MPHFVVEIGKRNLQRLNKLQAWIVYNFLVIHEFFQKTFAVLDVAFDINFQNRVHYVLVVTLYSRLNKQIADCLVRLMSLILVIFVAN